MTIQVARQDPFRNQPVNQSYKSLGVCVTGGGGRLIAGADSIDDMGLLRHGGMGRIFTKIYAPSTLGLAEARRRGAARMQLTTNKQRLRAHEFYQRLGFVPSHTGMKKVLV